MLVVWNKDLNLGLKMAISLVAVGEVGIGIETSSGAWLIRGLREGDWCGGRGWYVSKDSGVKAMDLGAIRRGGNH